MQACDPGTVRRSFAFFQSGEPRKCTVGLKSEGLTSPSPFGIVEESNSNPPPLIAQLIRRCRSAERASSILDELSLELGLSLLAPTETLAALALIRLGADSEKVASMLGWREFENLCAQLLSTAGYRVRSNVLVTKPRRQIDILATSSLLSLCIDCKHYARRISVSSLARFANAQIDRSRQYKERSDHRGPVLPMILTVMEGSLVVAEGVPVVPLLKLRSFLESINPYEGFAFV
jgi:hypothetical protein